MLTENDVTVNSSKRELIQEAPIFEDIYIEDITEGEDDGLKLLKISGIASRGDMFNRNKRMYPTKVLKKVAEKVQPLLKKGKLTGQVDHPGYFGDKGDLERTAIKFTRMWVEGDDLKFEGNVIPTTPGKELAVLLQSKVGVGMSTRGYGTMLPYKNKNGKEDLDKMVVQDDFELLGVDAVLNESNKYGKISQFEHEEGGNNVELNLETLKKDYPELVEELTKEVSEDVTKDFDSKVAVAVEAKVAEQKEAIRAEVMESDEIAGMKTLINSMIESVKPFVPGQQEYEESQKQKEIDELTAKLATAEENRTANERKLQEMEAEQALHELKAKVSEHVDAKVAGHRFAGQLKARLSECATVEDVDAMFDKEVAYIESLTKEKDDPTGTGIVIPESKDDSTQVLDKEKERQRKLAGIKSEGGK